MVNKEKASTVEGGMKVPLSSVGETFEKLVALVAKVNDIHDAEQALGVAQKAYNDGHVDDAKDLVTQIFMRLQDLGKAPKGLDAETVQTKILAGDSKRIVEDLTDQGKGVGVQKDGEVEKIVEKAPGIFSAKSDEADVAKKEIGTAIEAKRPEVVARETALLSELNKLLTEMEKNNQLTGEAGLIKGMREMVKEGWIGSEQAAEQIGSLKKRIKKSLQPNGVSSSLDIKSILVAREEKKLGKVVGVADKLWGEKVGMDRMTTFIGGLNKIEEATTKGIDLQEAVRSLHENEIREIRRFLVSSQEVPAGEEKSPNYDPMYAELIKKIEASFGESERIAAHRLAQAIDLNYTEMESVKGVDQQQVVRMRENAKKNGGAGMPMELDEFGRPTHGVEYMGGAANHERLEQLYSLGEEEFRRNYVEVPGGGYAPKNYEQILSEARERAERNISEQKLANMQHREAFVNVDMQALQRYMEEYGKQHPNNEFKISEMIDDEYYKQYSVTKLKEEVMRDEKQRKYFEKWWIQEKLHATRLLAYEGQFEKRQGSTRMIRFNSLDEIVGVSTAVKGYASWMAMSFNVIDQQNNAYVNQELMGKLNAFWTNQGVDFRLDNMLKMHREEICLFDERGEKGKTIGSLSMFDAITFMQKDILNDEIRKELGIPEWRDIKWGTMIYKYSAMDKRDKVRAIAWKHFAKTELGIYWDNNEVVPADQRDRVMGLYQNMFDLAFNFATSHKLLNTMIGDASFTKGKVELPGAAAEMHLKLDPILYPRLFAPRFNWLNVGFKELWFLFDPGVRDYVTMAPQDYAGHFTSFDVKKYLAWKNAKGAEKSELAKDLIRGGLEGENGSWTIMSGMLGGYSDKKVPELSDRHIEAANDLYQVFDNALWHWGAKPPGHHGKETDIMFELGVTGEKSTAFRRSAAKISKRLLEKRPSAETLSLIDWRKYCDIVQNPRIEEYLMGEHSDSDKWEFFAKTFGEGSFDHTTASTKRPGDHTMKYSFENYNKYVEAFLKWVKSPYNKTLDDALNEVPTAVAAPTVRPLQKKRFEYMRLVAEKLGRAELGGGSSYRLFRNPDTNQTEFDTSQGIGEDGDNQLPAYRIDQIKNNRSLADEIQNKSVAESLGFGTPQDPNWWIDYAKGLYAEGILSENDFEKLHKGILGGVWWEPKLGLVPNLWRYRKLEPLLEWIAPQLGITAHELEHIIEENTEKTAEKFWHYLNGGGH